MLVSYWQRRKFLYEAKGMAKVSKFELKKARREKRANLFHARLASWARSPKGFANETEPRTIGGSGRGRQLLAGKYLFGGQLIEAPPGTVLWTITPPNKAFAQSAHGSAWLDDLAAVGDGAARKLAQDWVFGWIEKYRRGSGEGWSPSIVGRRLLRWMNHSQMLLAGQDNAGKAQFFRSLGQQTVYLSRRWKTAEPGLARVEALAGLVTAGMMLEGMERRVGPAIAALALECERDVDKKGGIPSRNPDELLDLAMLITLTTSAMKEAGREIPKALSGALARIVPVLRALRHSDGALARFHGGERGAEGRLDYVLATSGVRTPAKRDDAMGFSRLSAGRTSVIVDTELPPSYAGAVDAHASTLAFELTSGRRPLIVNCGAGTASGGRWRRAGRATPSHSALCIDGVSSSRLGVWGKSEILVDGPNDVLAEHMHEDGEEWLSAQHDGWLATHGLTCYRELTLSANGRSLSGEDTLAASSPEEKWLFDYAMDGVMQGGIPFSVRFHLHPDAVPYESFDNDEIIIELKSGEVWVFRHEGSSELKLAPSVYLEKGRLEPRATYQIVLTSRVIDYSGHISWSLSKTVDTPSHLRDVETVEDEADAWN